jgi:hypothetical protein
MYYFQVSISFVFVIGLFASLAYLLSLSIKVATHLVDRKEAMRKSFVVSFATWMSMFIVYFIWQDRSNWNFIKWIMVVTLTTGFSIFMASLSALSFWQWKK